MTTETTQATDTATDFSAMTPAEVTAALERSNARAAAAYEALQAAQQARPPATVQAQAQHPAVHEFITDPEIHGAQTRVGQAQATFEREQKALYRADGTPRYSDAEHGERLASLRADFDRVVGSVQQTVDGLIAAHTTTLRHLAGGDPLDALTGEQLTKATQQMAYIKEDALSLPAADLVTRCQAALQMGDVPTLFNLARYVGQRLDANARAFQAGQEAAMVARASGYLGGQAEVSTGAQGATGQQSPDLTLAERQALGDLVAEMRARVRGTKGQQKAEATRAKLQTAREVKAAARTAHDSVHNTKAALEAHMLGSGRYSL